MTGLGLCFKQLRANETGDTETVSPLGICPMLSHPFFLMDPGFVREDNLSTGINIGTSQPPLQLGMSMCPSLVKEIKSEVSWHRFNSLWLLPSSYLNTNVMAGVEATILQP